MQSGALYFMPVLWRLICLHFALSISNLHSMFNVRSRNLNYFDSTLSGYIILTQVVKHADFLKISRIFWFPLSHLLIKTSECWCTPSILPFIKGSGTCSIQKCPKERHILGMWNKCPHPYTALPHKAAIYSLTIMSQLFENLGLKEKPNSKNVSFNVSYWYVATNSAVSAESVSKQMP